MGVTGKQRGRVLAAIVCGLFAGSGSAIAFFEGARIIAITQARDIGAPSASNSIKHAYAAAETYAVLRSAGLNPGIAERATIELGYLNEYAERVLKRQKDPPREVYKDLFNNMGGITAARFAESCPQLATHKNRLTLVTALARNNALPFVHWDARLPDLPEGAGMRAAINRFRADKQRIVHLVQDRLAALGMCGPGAPASGFTRTVSSQQ